jgi:hypothetical protein
VPELVAVATTGTVTLEHDGSGAADLRKLVARSMRATRDGSGDAEVTATDLLDATVEGSGALRYVGTPAKVPARGDGEITSAG